jgi:hypothetical protein
MFVAGGEQGPRDRSRATRRALPDHAYGSRGGPMAALRSDRQLTGSTKPVAHVLAVFGDLASAERLGQRTTACFVASPAS